MCVCVWGGGAVILARIQGNFFFLGGGGGAEMPPSPSRHLSCLQILKPTDVNIPLPF